MHLGAEAYDITCRAEMNCDALGKKSSKCVQTGEPNGRETLTFNKGNSNAEFGSALVKTQTRPACARFRFLGNRCAVDQPQRTAGQPSLRSRNGLLISGVDFGQREVPVDLHLGHTRSDSRI